MQRLSLVACAALFAGCATVRTSSMRALEVRSPEAAIEVRPFWTLDDGRERPVAGLEVCVREPVTGAEWCAPSAFDEAVVFAGLAPGRYEVELRASGEVLVVERVELETGKLLRLSIDLALVERAPPDLPPPSTSRRGIVREVIDFTWDALVFVGQILLGVTVLGLLLVLRVL